MKITTKHITDLKGSLIHYMRQVYDSLRIKKSNTRFPELKNGSIYHDKEFHSTITVSIARGKVCIRFYRIDAQKVIDIKINTESGAVSMEKIN